MKDDINDINDDTARTTTTILLIGVTDSLERLVTVWVYSVFDTGVVTTSL